MGEVEEVEVGELLSCLCVGLEVADEDLFCQALENRPSIRDTTSDREHYLPIYRRYAEDRAQSELAKSIRKGQGVV